MKTKQHHFSPSDFSPKKKQETKEKKESTTPTPPKKRFKKPFKKQNQYSKTEKKIDSKPTPKPKPKSKPFDPTKYEQKEFTENSNPYFQKKSKSTKPKKDKEQLNLVKNEKMPLNKYIAHCGICSRRDAIDLIKKGKIKVNGLVEVNPAEKVNTNDWVIYEDKRLFPQRNLVYFLLNKPKNYICTTEDPEERNTVLDFFKHIEDARLYPIGRLDRNTTGLIIITNDGELAQKLSHPKYNIKKVYQVGLDKALNKTDFETIIKGITLEDGKATVDEIAYINPKDKKEIGLQIHSGKNRIVRRIFEHLGYVVKSLDRVVYAGLTKKNIPRGTYRELTKNEIIFLKHFKH